jgi:hypothetical protein
MMNTSTVDNTMKAESPAEMPDIAFPSPARKILPTRNITTENDTASMFPVCYANSPAVTRLARWENGSPSDVTAGNQRFLRPSDASKRESRVFLPNDSCSFASI